MLTTEKTLIRQRFGKNLTTYGQNALVQLKVAHRLAEVLQQQDCSHFNRLLEIGAGTGFLTRALLLQFSVNDYFLNDLVPEAGKQIQRLTQKNDFHFLPGDAENISLPEKLDAIISTSTIQWFTNMCAFFERCRQQLLPEGYLAFSTFGKNNYKEIRRLLNVGLNYFGLGELNGMLAPHFTIVHSEEWEETLCFDSPVDVLKHIKQTGVNGISKTPFTRSSLKQFEDHYNQQFASNDGRVQLTYHPIIVIAKRNA